MQWWLGLLTNLAGSVVALYVMVVVAAWLGQRHLMYVPNPARVQPGEVGLRDVEERTMSTPDGERLVAWQAEPDAGRPTILYLHGNAGNLAGRADRLMRYHAQGFGVLMLSWRGYSGSTGRPSEARNVADALLAYDRLVSDGIDPESIVIYGESLGSGVAVQVAARRRVGAVVLDAPYTSIVDVALLSYPYLPVRPLLVDRYESDRHIKSVTAPVLIIHGERDAVIPVRMGRALHALAGQPKRLVLFPEGGHVDLDQYGAAEVVGTWIAENLGRPGNEPSRQPA